MSFSEARLQDFYGLRLDADVVNQMARVAENVEFRKAMELSKRGGMRRLNHHQYDGAIVALPDVQRICDYNKFLVISNDEAAGTEVYEHSDGTGGAGVDMMFDQCWTPICAANGAPLTGVAPLTVNFSSAGSFDPEGGPLTYFWNFGDGGTSTDANPSHQYAAGGSYTATLTVTNTCGKTASDTVGVTAISILVACGRDGAAWSNDEGATWNMSVGAPTGALNASYFLLAKGTDVFLFSQILGFVRVYRSTDLGQNFALVGSFVAYASQTYLAHPEVTSGGRIIYPHVITAAPNYRNVVSYSDDNGANWTTSGAVDGADHAWSGLTAIALLSSGVLVGATYKSQAPLMTRFYQSNDGGATWGAIISTLNDHTIGGLWAFGTTLFANTYDLVAARSKLYRSTDGGVTWPTFWLQPAGTATTSITKVGSRLFASLENFPLAGQATVCYSDDDGQNWTQADVLATSTGEYTQSWCRGNTGRFLIGFNRVVYGGNIGTFAAVGTAPAGILRGNAIARI